MFRTENSGNKYNKQIKKLKGEIKMNWKQIYDYASEGKSSLERVKKIATSIYTTERKVIDTKVLAYEMHNDMFNWFDPTIEEDAELTAYIKTLKGDK